MSKFLMIVIFGMSLLISACNGDDDADKEHAQPKPQSNCKMHCAP